MPSETHQPTEILKVKFTATASQEVKSIVREIAKEHQEAAQKVRDTLVTKAKNLLSETPYIGRLLYEFPEYEKRGVRRYLPISHYSILYLVTDGAVEIWHVWDKRRDWTTLFDK